MSIILGDLNGVASLSADDWQYRNGALKGFGTAGASVVDVGVTMWNSVANLATLGNYNDISTRSVLQSIGSDGMVSAYDNNRDAVELLSFIGGVFIPGGAALKLSRAVRAGTKGTNFLSPVRHKEDLAKFDQLIKGAKEGTTEYRNLKRTAYLRGQAENAMDTVAAELAIMGTFNAHPYMDDYFEDPVKNIGISLALGGVLGGGVSALISRSEMRNVLGVAQSAVADEVLQASRLYATPYSDTSSAVIQLDLAAKNLTNIAAHETISPAGRQLATNIAASMRANIGQILDGTVSPDILKGLASVEERDAITSLLMDPKMIGAEKMKFYTPSKQASVTPPSVIQRATTAIFRRQDPVNAEDLFIKDVYYNQELGSFIPKSAADSIVNAADLSSLKGLDSLTRKYSIKQLTSDFKDKLDFARGGEIELDYLARLKFYSGRSTRDLVKAELIADDLPAINGWLGAVKTRTRELEEQIAELTMEQIDGSDTARKLLGELQELRSAKVKLYEADRVKLVNLDEVSGLPIDSLDPSSYVSPRFFEEVGSDVAQGNIPPLVTGSFVASAGITDSFYAFVAKSTGNIISEDYSQLLYKIPPRKMEELSKQFAADNADRISGILNQEAGLSAEAGLMLARWISGAHADKEVFRNAMASARTLRNGMESATPYHDSLLEVLNSPVIQRQRDALAKRADGNGNIYLLRGQKTSPRGDTTVSSFTHSRDTAEGFGKGGHVGTYKIHLDDVVGYLYSGESEWLVGTTTREASTAADLAKAQRELATGRAPTGPSMGPRFNTLEASQVESTLVSKKLQGIEAAIRAGESQESIALKYNLTNEMAELLGSGDPGSVMDRASVLRQQYREDFNSLFNRWNSPTQLDDAFAATRRTLQVTAKEQNIMGASGDILQQQRDAILGLSNLTAVERNLLNQLDGEGAQHLAGKFAMIDQQFNDINNLFIQDVVASSNSPLAHQLFNRLVDDDLTSILREGLKEFVNGKGGNPLYSSADFVTSRMGEVGRVVTELGDRRVHTVNKFVTELLTPASAQLTKVVANPVARTEFAIFDNLRQSTKGVLRYDADARTFVTTGEGIEWDRSAKSFITNGLDQQGQPITIPVQGIVAYPEHVVKDPSVHEALLALQHAGDESWAMQASVNKLKGVQTPSDVGFWIPSTNVTSANRAFVLNKDDSSLRMLVGNSEEDLKRLITDYDLQPNQSILTPADVDALRISNHGDLMDEVGRADVEQVKKGIGLAVPDISPDRLSDIIGGIKDRFNYQATSFMENALYDVTSKLDYMSAYNKNLSAKQGAPGFQRAVKQLQSKDTARDIKAILTGNSQAGSQEFMGYINKFTSASMHFGIKSFQGAFNLVKPLSSNQQIDYEKFTEALKALGIEDPFKVFHEAARAGLYERALNSGYTVTPDRLVNAGNSLSSVLALRFMEIAQPLVNAMSLPILQISTISRAIKAEGIHGSRDILENGQLAIMYNGVRRAQSSLPVNRKFLNYFEEEGLLTPIVSEVDALIKQTRFGTGGVVGGLEKALDSKFVQLMSTPGDWTDSKLRQISLMTGVELAYRIYGPNVSDTQVKIFARDFLKQTIGNYSTSQRPMMFQGTFGAAMGLFQTYMLTYAQNLYRHIDLKDYKGLGQTMLAQGGIFGAGSLPGFSPISQQIGTHFSDENVDLTTGLYRGLPDPVANVLIYGMPSTLAPSVHTRGDVTPRIPDGFTAFVAPSMIGQILDSFVDVGQSILQADRNSGQAFMEALSMQSVSRPIARLSELTTGYAVTRAGNQVAGPDEVWSWGGIVARVFSTRTLQEAKAREAIHLDSVYASANSANRRAVLETLRTAIRNGSVDNDMMDNLAYEYMRTGSPQGFRQAVNQAFLENESTKLLDLNSRLGNSTLMWMVDDLD